jgi:hypothetical protein
MIKHSLQVMPNVNRVEVIDGSGRAYMALNVTNVQIQQQDDGETLKIFLDRKKEQSKVDDKSIHSVI